jgi:23S rRNA (adenine2503-C2)-methyltransferase
MTQRLDLYDFTRLQLASLVKSWGFRPVHAARVWRSLYWPDSREAVLAELPRALQDRLAAETRQCQLRIDREAISEDHLAHKYLFGLADGRQIETVLMRYSGRVTACLSSQVGCALGCLFCASGQMGFGRNLTTGEIVAQALRADQMAHRFHGGAPGDKGGRGRPDEARLRNLVLMGMGEPLQNYDAVMRAVEILCDDAGLAIRPKRVTLSTVGVVPGIIRMADERRKCALAVSLHAATQEERAAMIPAARAWPLEALMEACRYYVRKTAGRIFFEWTLIDGKNNSIEAAHALAHLVDGLPAHVNLIPLNSTAGYGEPPASLSEAHAFQAVLRSYGLPATVRQRRGIEIGAGCGQLAVLPTQAGQRPLPVA